MTEIHYVLRSDDYELDDYGGELIQKSIVDIQFHPIYFASRKRTEAERKYASYELMVLTVIETVKKFRIYVLSISN